MANLKKVMYNAFIYEASIMVHSTSGENWVQSFLFRLPVRDQRAESFWEHAESAPQLAISPHSII